MHKTILSASLLGGIVALHTLPAAAAARTYDSAPFTGVRIESSLNASIEIGAVQSIRAETADVADLDKLRFEVVDGHLRAWIDRDLWDLALFNNPRVTITIVTPSLIALSADAASNVVASAMTGDKVSIDVASGADITVRRIAARLADLSASSAGTLDLSGTCANGNVQISSGASISGKALECVDLAIEASSGGSGILFASGQVDAQVSGGANVQLAGHPDHVDDEVSSGADVTVLR